MIVLNKRTDQTMTLRIYDSYKDKNPVDLSNYVDFVCAITEDGRLLIEKKMSTNSILITRENEALPPYTMIIKFKNTDTKNLQINPPDEERIRIFQLFGIDNSGKIDKILEDNFYLQGSGYYVSR